MLFVQSVQGELGDLQFVLGVGNELAVGGDLVVEVFDLGIEQSDLLIHCIFLIDQHLNLAGVGIVVSADGVDLALNGLVIVLQGVQLRLDLGGLCRCLGIGGQDAAKQRRCQDQGQ